MGPPKVIAPGKRRRVAAAHHKTIALVSDRFHISGHVAAHHRHAASKCFQNSQR